MIEPDPDTTPTDSSTLELVHFENVRDNGIIETPTTYSMLVEIDSREWLTLSDEKRSTLYVKFLTYLRGVQFPTQFLTLTTRFDADDYYEQFVGPDAPGASTQGSSTIRPREAATGNAPSNANASSAENSTAGVDAAADATADSEAEDTAAAGNGADDESGAAPAAADPDIQATDGGATAGSLITESPLLEYGRHTHTQWLKQVISGGDVRDRQYVVAVAIEKGNLSEESGGRGDSLRDRLPIGSTASREVTNEDDYLEEVWTRAHRVAAQLPRTDVEAAVLTSRREVLNVLYQTYRGHEAPISFDHAVVTRPEASTLTDPSTGDPLDLEAAFHDADQQEASAAEENTAEAKTDREESDAVPPRPVSTDDRPLDGRVEPAYAETVEGSRILQWYARNIGPIGTGSGTSTPHSVYAGAFLFGLSLALGIAAFATFLVNGQAQFAPLDSATYWLVREASFGLAAVSLPVFLLSLVVLLPSGRVTHVAGLVGTAITGGAVYLFQEAYPMQWDVSNMATTTLVVEVYAAGLALLVLAVALAVRSRRLALEIGQSPVTSKPTTDGSGAPSRNETPHESEPTDTGAETATDGGTESAAEADSQKVPPDGGSTG